MAALHLLWWWLVVQVLWLAALPICLLALRPLPDRGTSVAKPFGILALAYPLWLIGSLGFLDNSRMSYAIVLVAVMSTSAAIWRRRSVSLLAFLKDHRGLLIVQEALFIVAFLGFGVIRMFNPEVVGTEKFMDFAFMSGALRSERLPPLDPWLSGHTINYYYFGHLIVAVLTKLSGLPLAETFNLTVALLFALAAVGAFGVAFNLVQVRRAASSAAGTGPARRAGRRRRRHVAAPDTDTPSRWWRLPGAPVVAVATGLLAVYLLLIGGNLQGPLAVLRDPSYLSRDYWQGMGWHSSRVLVIKEGNRDIDYTINEFPAFSFLLGDLHPHVLALPFVLLALQLALSWWLRPPTARWAVSRTDAGAAARMIVGTAILGALYILNSWDFPTYFALAATAASAAWLSRRPGWEGIKTAAAAVALTGLLAVALYLPFYASFRPPASRLGLVPIRSQLHQFATFFGLMAVPSLAFVATVLPWRRLAPIPSPATIGKHLARERSVLSLTSGPSPRERGESFRGKDGVGTTLALGLVGVVAVAMARGSGVLALTVALGLAAAWSAWRNRHRRAVVFGLGLFALAMALLATCEVVYVRDFYGEALRRMNTVFKLYYQAWLLLALAGAFGTYVVAESLWRRARAGNLLARGLLVSGVVVGLIVVGLGLVYPTVTTLQRTDSFRKVPTLDGFAWMQRFHPEDYAAAQWLRRNVRGTPVLLEAVGGPYSDFARLATQTGLPTVLGWTQHERLWRGPPAYAEVERRARDVDVIYLAGDLGAVRDLLAQYQIEYIAFGYLEAQKYGPAARVALDASLKPVFRAGSTAIYRVGSALGRSSAPVRLPRGG